MTHGVSLICSCLPKFYGQNDGNTSAEALFHSISYFSCYILERGGGIIASYTTSYGFNCSFIRKMLLSVKGGTWIQKSGKGGTQAKKG